MNWEKWKDWADRTIPHPSDGVVRKKKNYRLSDIAGQCRDTFRAKRHELKTFASAFPPNEKGLKMLFRFCDRFFRYKADMAYDERGNEIPVQALQSPAALWHYKVGDCKSYTVFIASVVHHMGFPGEMRLVDYGNPLEKHIYPVAFLDGRPVPVDVVFKKQQNGAFGTEKNHTK